MTTFSQRTFAGGEIAPALYARVDTVKYVTGARQLRNMMVLKQGGAANRPGTEFVAEVKDSTKQVRLLPFVFNAEQTYVLEFGDLYMRVHKQGAQVTLAAQNITGITNANPAVLTYSGSDTFANGDEVFVEGVTGAIAPFVNGRSFKVANVDTGANTFELNYLDGTAVNSTAWGAYGSGGTVEEVYEISTPYLEADLATLTFVQSADVITIAHPNYAPRELLRTGDAAWLLAEASLGPSILPPRTVTVASGGAGTNTYWYRVTAVALSGEESLAGTGVGVSTITNVTQANPPVVTTSGANLYQTGGEVILSGIVGMTELNGRRFTVTRLSSTTFSLNDTDSTSYTAYSSGGTVTSTGDGMNASAAAPTAAAPHVVTWLPSLPGPAGTPAYYRIYRATALDGAFGAIGVSPGLSYRDVGATVDFTQQPPALRNVFDLPGRYPAAVAYYQERLCFGGADNSPETVFTSRTGAYRNFTTHVPSQDDDAITFTVGGAQVNRIRHLLDVGALGLFTSGAEHVCLGENGVLLPSAVNRKEQSDHGIGDLRPLKVGKTVLFVQGLGSIVRDFLYDFQVDGYNGNDVTNFASHLFDGHTLVDWSYAKVPNSMVLAVRDDGVLLGLTYVREQQILAWFRLDSDGTFENVCAVPEGRETAIYAVIKRTVNGKTVRYVERFSSRFVTASTMKDAIFMDSTISYDGRHSGSTTMTLSGGTTWEYDETLTLTASASTFEAADVGRQFQLTGSDGTLIRFTVNAYTSGTVVTGKPHKTVPVAMRGVAIATWARAIQTLTGLWHLEGQQVSITGDAFVVASANNDSYVAKTVANGQVTLDRPYAVIHVGLPYLPDTELLDIDTDQAETLADKKKLISRVTLTLEGSRGIWIGAKPPSDDSVNPREGLVEMKLRDSESYDEPPTLITDNRDVNIQGQWNTNGRVFIRQLDPLPLTILAVAPAGMVPVRR